MSVDSEQPYLGNVAEAVRDDIAATRIALRTESDLAAATRMAQATLLYPERYARACRWRREVLEHIQTIRPLTEHEARTLRHDQTYTALYEEPRP